MVLSFAGKVSVITGAAHGLGRALATELAARGSHLALMDIDSDAVKHAAQDLARGGVRVTHHTADVACLEEVERAAGEVRGAHGCAHLLINNAGVSASSSFQKTSAADFERVMRVNYFGVVNGCRAFLPLLEAGAGQILNVSSCFAWIGYPRKTAYASSKAAVRAFSESLRGETACLGVGVTVLYPGPLATALVRRGVSDSEQLRDREEAFLRARGLSLQRVARRALGSLLRNPARIVIGLDYHLLDLMARLSPGLACRAMGLSSKWAGF